MKSLNSATFGVLLLTALLWPTSGTALEGEEVAAEVKKHSNDPVACGCSLQDDIDLKSRIASLNAVISEFHAQKKPYSGSKQKLTPAIRSTVSNAVSQKLNAAKDSKARVAGAVTYDIGCFTLIDSSATPCLRGALEDHESVHRAACDAHSSSDWRYDQLVEDWIQEEIDAYQKELDRLNAEQNKRLPFCTLDKSVKKILWQLAEEKEREKEAKEILDWVSELFN
jgi:uncharacterized small protein (DUF1192 family)